MRIAAALRQLEHSVEKHVSYVFAECEESRCDWIGLPKDCETDWEQDSWETPPYEVAFCPKCNEPSVVFYDDKFITKTERIALFLARKLYKIKSLITRESQ